MFMPSGVIAAASGHAPLGTSHNLIAGATGTGNTERAGFDIVRDPAIGSLDPDVFNTFDIGCILSTVTPNYIICLGPTPVPDTDESWREIIIDGVFSTGQDQLRFLRKNFFYQLDVNGFSQWNINNFIEGQKFVDGNPYNVLFLSS